MTATERGTLVGHVAELRRYPLKSAQGERLASARLGPDGIEGDRRFAVIDAATGHVASAKNPRKWGTLLDLRAELRNGALVVTGPDGTEHRDDLSAVLSRLLGRAVELRGPPTAPGAIEIEWPDVSGLPGAGTSSVEPLPAGGYFDLAPIHLLTTASLRRFRECAPGVDFDPSRFRPNLVIETLPELNGFIENDWLGRSLFVGDIELLVTAPCSRCVMTTLAQPGLSADPQVLRAAVAHNGAAVGAYATVVRAGAVRPGAAVYLG